jgi:hypothetical protein
MALAADVLEQAKADLGYTESPMNRTKFGVFYGMNGVPWCAQAVSKWFYDAGLPLPAKTAKGFAWCQDGVSWFKQQQRFDRKPKIGDVVFYQFDRDASADHVGVVESVGDGFVIAIEGNTNSAGHRDGGSVMRKQRPMSLVLGFGHPPYNGNRKRGPIRPTPTVPAWPGRDLKRASPFMKGDDVTTWQAQMRRRGWDIDVDGFYGEQSRKVCLAFQQEKRDWCGKADGVVGSRTWSAAWRAPLT